MVELCRSTLLYYASYLIGYTYQSLRACLHQVHPADCLDVRLRSYRSETSIGTVTEDIRRETANMWIGIHLVLDLLDTILPEREIGCACL